MTTFLRRSPREAARKEPFKEISQRITLERRMRAKGSIERVEGLAWCEANIGKGGKEIFVSVVSLGAGHFGEAENIFIIADCICYISTRLVGNPEKEVLGFVLWYGSWSSIP
jgi:hypothetical protein